MVWNYFDFDVFCRTQIILGATMQPNTAKQCRGQTCYPLVTRHYLINYFDFFMAAMSVWIQYYKMWSNVLFANRQNYFSFPNVWIYKSFWLAKNDSSFLKMKVICLGMNYVMNLFFQNVVFVSGKNRWSRELRIQNRMISRITNVKHGSCGSK